MTLPNRVPSSLVRVAGCAALADHTATNATLTFAPGATSKTVAVTTRQRIALRVALATSIDDLDGTFPFLVSTRDEIGYAKERLAVKPMIMYETDDLVADASAEVPLNRESARARGFGAAAEGGAVAASPPGGRGERARGRAGGSSSSATSRSGSDSRFNSTMPARWTCFPFAMHRRRKPSTMNPEVTSGAAT